jgi:long-chain acyl-CoA synthetase
MNLANLLIRAGRSRRECPAVGVGAAMLWSYGELAERAARLAGALRAQFGLEPGERVALVMRNCPEFLELLYACWHAGLAAVPVNAKLHPLELRYILGHSGARLCFATPDLTAALEAESAGLDRLAEVIDVHAPDYRSLMRSERIDLVPRGPDDLAWLFYTSGTTGRPKGAMLSHRNLMTMIGCYYGDVDGIAPGDCILHAAPLSHGSGLYGLPHLAAGVCQVIPESGAFDPAEIFALLPARPGLMIFAAPTMVKRLVDHPAAGAADTADLKTIVYGGAPMYLEDLKRGQERFGHVFAQIYGQGESPMTITALSKADHADTSHARHAARLASAGRAQTAVEVRVADARNSALPPGELGEVLVRGDTVMPGYWDDPAASAAALEGGWLHTGDIGAFDEDGYLTLKDRSKDLIISGGANIYPREVEEALQSHPDVQECAVVGRPHPEWGEEIVAFVVPRAEAGLNAEALDAHCLERIARFKRPKAYRFVEALPKNNYGKILKTEIRAWAEKEDGDAGQRS